jgi:hypothetical protein
MSSDVVRRLAGKRVAVVGADGPLGNVMLGDFFDGGAKLYLTVETDAQLQTSDPSAGCE